ncbi:MAG: phosphoglycolate phosphatase [Thermoplasmata archaeon]|nr:phosphoglycolate phosphatase [Thermoplasmata archaeon]
MAPPRGSIRAIVTDVDGTLTDAHRVLDREAALLLQRAERHRISVTLATGNVLPIALALHRSLGLTGPIVAENGGILYDVVNGRPRIERCADRAIAYRAFRAVRRAGVPVHRLFTDRWRETEVAIEASVPAREVRRHVDRSEVRVESTGYAIHLIERGCGKLSTLRRALARRGLAPADCLIAGDGDNDVGMLRAAGWALSFAGASERARRAADFVTNAPNARGFVEGLIRSNVVAR